MNTVVLTGRLTDDAKTFDNGPARLRIAVNKRAKDKETGEFKYVTAGFFTVIAWDELKNRVANLSKGQLVMVGGRLESRSYEKDGQKRESIEIVAEEVMVPVEGRAPEGTDDW